MNNPILAPAAAHSKAAQALDYGFSGVTMSRATASGAMLAAPRMTAGLMNSGRAGIRYENSSNQARLENNEIHGDGKTERRGGVSTRDAQNATVRNNVFDGGGYTHNQAPDNVAVHASDSGRSDREVDLNKRLIKRSAFLKMLGGMGVAMTPAASAFAYGGCGTGSYYAQYYAGVNFNTLRKSQCEAAPLDKNWGRGDIFPLGRADNVSARWTGEFNFQQPGEYEFTATADDGIRVYVDGVRIIDEWRDQYQATFKARRQLAAGIHKVRVEYYERLYDALCSLSWARISSPPPESPARILGAAVTTGPFAQYSSDIDAFNAKTGYVHPVIHTYDRFGEYGLDYGKIDIFNQKNIDMLWTWEPHAVTLSSIAQGTRDAWIDEQARLIARFPAVTVYVRFAHEMNGNWYSWGQQPAAYKVAFQRLADRIHALAPNAQMVWCPNIDFPISDYYPGHSYVDWMALDGYNMDGISTPEQVLASDYDILKGINSTKPIMLAETGCMEYPGKPGWITDLYTRAIPERMEGISMVCYFDVEDINLYPQRYHLASSLVALDAYRAVADRPEWG